MRVLVLAASACVVLAGCGGAFGGPSDKQALVSACVEQGESEATCSCATDALQKNLSPELFTIWLSHFNNSVDENFKGQKAEQIKTQALSIATVMQIKISQKKS